MQFVKVILISFSFLMVLKKETNLKIIYLLLSVIWATFCYANNQVLLVGTTGDYPPLTLKTESGYTGTDIQIIQAFAQAKKLSIKFISTTWPGLTQDLLNHKFDVAVGGISENPTRNKLFYRSQTITTTAKAALIRCGDQQRFKSLASIDTESVLIVENRGGTNQDFALSNIKLASILLVRLNQDALARLTNGGNLADVLFTDDVEIKYFYLPKLRIGASYRWYLTNGGSAINISQQ